MYSGKITHDQITYYLSHWPFWSVFSILQFTWDFYRIVNLSKSSSPTRVTYPVILVSDTPLRLVLPCLWFLPFFPFSPFTVSLFCLLFLSYVLTWTKTVRSLKSHFKKIYFRTNYLLSSVVTLLGNHQIVKYWPKTINYQTTFRVPTIPWLFGRNLTSLLVKEPLMCKIWYCLLNFIVNTVDTTLLGGKASSINGTKRDLSYVLSGTTGTLELIRLKIFLVRQFLWQHPSDD